MESPLTHLPVRRVVSVPWCGCSSDPPGRLCEALRWDLVCQVSGICIAKCYLGKMEIKNVLSLSLSPERCNFRIEMMVSGVGIRPIFRKLLLVHKGVIESCIQ